jgi:hypothetical protein
MSNTNDQERKKEKEKTKRLKEFYNYKHWREIQRNQLTISSNIFFTLSVASVGYSVNHLIEHKYDCLIIRNIFMLSMFFFIISIIIYFLLNIVKLVDYRRTSQLIDKDTSSNQIRNNTSSLGNWTWYLFYTEIITCSLGLLILVFAFYQIISI